MFDGALSSSKASLQRRVEDERKLEAHKIQRRPSVSSKPGDARRSSLTQKMQQIHRVSLSMSDKSSATALNQNFNVALKLGGTADDAGFPVLPGSY